MELSETQMAFIFAGCVLAISGIVIALRRGWLNPKTPAPAAPAPAADAVKPAQ